MDVAILHSHKKSTLGEPKRGKTFLNHFSIEVLRKVVKMRFQNKSEINNIGGTEDDQE